MNKESGASKTIVIYKINPKNIEKPDNAIAAVKGISMAKLTDIKKEEIGFGIVVIKAVFLIEGNDKEIEQLTAKLNSLEAIDRAAVESMTLA